MCAQYTIRALYQCDEVTFVEKHMKRYIISEETLNCVQHFVIRIQEVI